MKSFKFGQKVYVAMVDAMQAFSLVKGHIVGVRIFKTSTDNYAYMVTTPRGEVEVLADDLYESVDDFKSAVDLCVVG